MTGLPPGTHETRRLTLGRPFVLESGQILPDVEIAYRSWGKLSPGADNAIVVCHALTGSADADIWWRTLFGENRALDPARHFIVCSNVLGGCYGTTGPTSIAADGLPWGARFPRITVRDQVRLQIALADELGIRSIRCVIGGSMGGLQALEWALLDARRVKSVISIAASGRHSPWCIAWSEAQRLAIAADPRYKNGHYAPDSPPIAGLLAARTVAMISYRSAASLEERFGRHNGHAVFGERASTPEDFAVSGWLRHHGKALVERFDANSYCTLLDAMDTHDLARLRGEYHEVLRQIKQPVLVGSVSSDALYVPAEQRTLADSLPHAELFEIESSHGHDGFLIDTGHFGERIRHFIHLHSNSINPVTEAPPSRPVLGAALRYTW